VFAFVRLDTFTGWDKKDRTKAQRQYVLKPIEKVILHSIFFLDLAGLSLNAKFRALFFWLHL